VANYLVCGGGKRDILSVVVGSQLIIGLESILPTAGERIKRIPLWR